MGQTGATWCIEEEGDQKLGYILCYSCIAVFFNHARSACDLSIVGGVYGVLSVLELELATLGLSCLNSISALPELDIKSILAFLAFLASFIVVSLALCLAVVRHGGIE